MAAELPCGDGPDARYCPKFWEQDAEIKRLREGIEDLAATWAEDDARPGNLTRDEYAEQHVYRECAKSLRALLAEVPAERERHVSEVAGDGGYIYGSAGE